MPIINIPKPLREKLGEEATDSLIEVLREFEKEIRNGVIEAAEDRFARRLSEEMEKLRAEVYEKFSEVYDEIGKLKAEMHDEIGKLRAEMHDEIGKLKVEVSEKIERLKTEMYNEIGKLKAEMYQFKGDIVKWMFIFWIGQVIALGSLMFALLKLL